MAEKLDVLGDIQCMLYESIGQAVQGQHSILSPHFFYSEGSDSYIHSFEGFLSEKLHVTVAIIVVVLS